MVAAPDANPGFIASVPAENPSESKFWDTVLHKTKRAGEQSARITKRVLWSTGKAAWILGTSFVILVMPLIIEMDREQQMVDIESQQAGLLGPVPPSGLPPR
eukprot:TRINITY_DN18773_c0_g1_i1.p2 TRINITY_DN18773_c0_g1~~TRINITY_DN18773_c0_g1_i1.p2  ORF type:complete len:102 (+),score=15.00 TRINITY_DN18773_c0_g1_i1:45-350(+)